MTEDRVQRPVALGEERGGRVIAGTGLCCPVPDQHRMGQAGARGDAAVRPCHVVRAQDADRDIGEREVDQGFVPDGLAPLRSGPGLPQGLRDAADPVTRIGTGESANRGNDTGRVAADPGHIRPAHAVDVTIEMLTQNPDRWVRHGNQDRLGATEPLIYERAHAGEELSRAAVEGRRMNSLRSAA